jgi:hypothetical protein
VKVDLLVSPVRASRWTRRRCLQLGVYDTTFYGRRLLSIRLALIATARLHCVWRHLAAVDFTSLGISNHWSESTMLNTHCLHKPQGLASACASSAFTRAHKSRLHQIVPDRRSFPAVHVPLHRAHKLAGWHFAHRMMASMVGTSQPRVSAELPRVIFAGVPLQEVPRCIPSSSPVAKHTDVLIQRRDLPARVSF